MQPPVASNSWCDLGSTNGGAAAAAAAAAVPLLLLPPPLLLPLPPLVVVNGSHRPSGFVGKVPPPGTALPRFFIAHIRLRSHFGFILGKGTYLQ